MLYKSEGSYSQLQRQLYAIEKQLLKPISRQTCTQVFAHLDEIAEEARSLRQETTKTSTVFTQFRSQEFQTLEDKTLSLYGRALDSMVAKQVAAIQEETSHLEETLSSGNESQIQKTAALLEKQITILLNDHRLAKEDLPIIAKAHKTLKAATTKLSTRQEMEEVLHHFTFLARQPSSLRFIEEEIDLMPEEIEELFSIAEHTFHGQMKTARQGYLGLPEDTKRRVLTHLSALDGSLFEDPIKTIQSLIATANDLVQNDLSYPSPEDVAEMFKEVQMLSDADCPD